MSILTHIKNLFRQRDTNTASPSASVDETTLPPPPPPISCFVKGVIRSMETEPEKWIRETFVEIIYWNHRESNTQWSRFKNRLTINWNALELTAQESFAIALAEKEYLVKHYDRQIAECRAANARDMAKKTAKAKAMFEKLGCPEKSP